MNEKAPRLHITQIEPGHTCESRNLTLIDPDATRDDIIMMPNTFLVDTDESCSAPATYEVYTYDDLSDELDDDNDKNKLCPWCTARHAMNFILPTNTLAKD